MEERKMATLEVKKAKIQTLLAKSPAAIEKAIKVIYARQTQEEKAGKSTVKLNGIGFSAGDAEFLSSLAEWLLKGRHLTYKQMASARKMVPRYWRQLIEEADIKSPGWAEEVKAAPQKAAWVDPEIAQAEYECGGWEDDEPPEIAAERKMNTQPWYPKGAGLTVYGGGY
jgi:hypothetical protein